MCKPVFKFLGMKENLLIVHQCDSITKHSSDPLTQAQDFRAYLQQGSDTLSQYPNTGGEERKAGLHLHVSVCTLHARGERFDFSVQLYEICYSNVDLSPCCKSKVQRLLITESSIFQYRNGSKRKDKQHKDNLRLTLYFPDPHRDVVYLPVLVV